MVDAQDNPIDPQAENNHPTALPDGPSAQIARLERALRDTKRALAEKDQALRDTERALRDTKGALQDTERARAEQETRLRAMVEYAPGGVVVLDENLKVVMSNPLARQIYGRLTGRLDRSAGQPPLDVYYPDGQPYPTDQLPMVRAAREGLTFLNVEIAVRAQDGEEHTLLLNCAPLLDADGRPRGAITTFRDMTELRWAAETLARSEVRYQRLFDSPITGTLLADSDGNLLEVNDALVELTGYTRDELRALPHGWQALTPPEYQALDEMSLLEARQNGVCLPYEKDLIHKDGARLPVLVSCTRLLEPRYGGEADDRVERVIAFVIDIRKQRTAQASAQKEFAARSSEAAQTEFAVRASEAAQRELASAHASELTAQREFALARANEAILRSALRHAGVMIFCQNLDLRYDWVFDPRLGTLDSQVNGKTDAELYPAAGEEIMRRKRAVLESGVGYHEETAIQVGGEHLYEETTVQPLYNEKGQITGLVNISVDVTGHRRTQDALEESRRRLELATEAAEIGVWDFEPERERLVWDDTCRAIYGVQDENEMTTDRFKALIHPQDLERFTGSVIKALETGEGYDNEYRVVWPDGSIHWVYARGRAVFGTPGRAAHIAGVSLDITDNKRLEAEMLSSKARLEVQRSLLRHLEAERTRLARDLHDGPIQELAGMGFAIQAALERNPGNAVMQLGLNALRAQTQQLMAELRAVCNDLRPPSLAQFGVEKAIRSHAEGLAEKYPQLTLSLHLTKDGSRLPEETRLALFRIYQEALNNTIKHAQADQVTVRFELDGTTAELEISDNGRGFTTPGQWVSLTRHGHFGLVGIQEHAEAAGGTAQVISRPGAGTTVLVRVPLAENTPDSDG